MTSIRQLEANRRNALRSTGPRTENGKLNARLNAVRHGLTAETVIVGIEDLEDYKRFEAAVILDYDAQSAVERELVLRLASLLWRLRRATAIETGLMQIAIAETNEFEPSGIETAPGVRNEMRSGDNQLKAHCFLTVANLENGILDRLTRYEVALWRQVGQTLLTLEALDRRKPQERYSRVSCSLWRSSGQCP